MAKKIKWTVEFSIDESWVADGFTLDKEEAERMIQERLPYSYGHETSARIVAKPDDKTLAKIQGFDSVQAFRRANKF